MTVAGSATPKRIVHLGLGSFHRAHQAVYMQALLDLGELRWTLCAGNLRNDMADTLAALSHQKGRYTLETISAQGDRKYQTINAIQTVVPYAANLAPLRSLIAASTCRIASFTVTEAGYYLDSHDSLDLTRADIVADMRALQSGGAGHTIYGALTAMLRDRIQQGSGPITLLNCDNLRHNGQRFRSGLLQFLEALGDKRTRQWVLTNTTCPNAMVDRITPRPNAQVRERVKLATGVDDAASLMAESFIQWVIEDRFIAGRPPWESVGVEMVADVTPYEEAKIRVLNASHSCIAWAGTLRGYTYIHEGAQDALIRQWAHDYVSHDALPCLLPSPIDLPRYRDIVLERFQNPAIADTNQRVAMDGFSKIPGFIAPTLRERLSAGRAMDAVAKLPALFLAFLQCRQRGDLPYVYHDQAMPETRVQAICQAGDTEAVIAAFCADFGLWGDLAADARLVNAVTTAYRHVTAALNLKF